jgi:hypothetical protein
VTLPGDVSEILEVRVDGEVLPSTAYILYNDGLLVRTDGETWPLCNDLSLEDTEVGTWSITMTTGTQVPTLGKMAVSELALQLALACVDDAECKLPSSVQSLVRQGVTLTFLDPSVVFADGKIGLYRCDLFISTFNPSGIAERAHAIDVDGPKARRQVWP